jgi:hypothetical protein
MSSNRIRAFENLWKSLGAAGGATSDKPAAPMPREVPPGFALFPLAHLTPSEKRAIAAQTDLYQRAYDVARREADAKFIRDWVI